MLRRELSGRHARLSEETYAAVDSLLRQAGVEPCEAGGGESLPRVEEDADCAMVRVGKVVVGGIVPPERPELVPQVSAARLSCEIGLK